MDQQIIDDPCEQLNIIYDKKFNKYKIYDMGKWNGHAVMDNFIHTVLVTVQEHYFNTYECYLIRKIEVSSLCYQDKIILKDRLSDFYKFIGCFQIEPYVKDKNDTQIMFNPDDKNYDSCQDLTDENTEISIKYFNLYARVDGETTKSFSSTTKKNVLDIFKKNTLHNMEELNKAVIALFNMDEEFKTSILPTDKK